MGDHRDVLGGPVRRSSVTPSRAGAVYAATPGRRAALASERTAATLANAATSSYVGRRVADRPLDAPSTTLGDLPGLSFPVAAAALPPVTRLAPVDFSHLTAPDPLLAPSMPSAPRSATALAEAPVEIAREPARLDTGVIEAVLAHLEPVDQTTSFVDEATASMPLLTTTSAGSTASAAPTPVAAGRRRATRHTGRRGPLFRGLPSMPLLLGVAALAVSAGGAITAGSAQLTSASPTTVGAANAFSGTSGVGTVGLTRDDVTTRGTNRVVVGATPSAAVDAAAQARNSALQQLGKSAEKQAAIIKENQWQTPLDSYRLTARFGQYGLWSSYHTGLDFAAPSGTPIHAIANGVVTSASYDGSYGNKTVITLDDGTELWYCHQTSFAVNVGDTVRGGDLIGYVGSTGNTTGPHVHIEVRPGGGDPVDPYPAFVEHGVTP